MKKLLLLFVLLPVSTLLAGSRDLMKYVPQHSLLVVGADFSPLRSNSTYVKLEKEGRIWSKEDDSELAAYFNALQIQPRRDIKNFVFSKYLNSYGNKGEVKIFELQRDISSRLSSYQPAKYLDVSLYRINPDSDMYAVAIAPMTYAFGHLNEVKMVADLSRGKSPGVVKNAQLLALYEKIPAAAPVWGVAVPVSRKVAAASNTKQSTNPLLQAFDSYYFYGVPGKEGTDSHFFGQAAGEKEALFASTFLTGTLTFARFRVDEELAEKLEQINIRRNGRTIHVNAVVTQELVDAYFNGELEID